MKKTYLLTLLILLNINVFAQLSPESQAIMNNFRQLEMKSWNESRLQALQTRGDSSIDVKFYHLSIEIAIDSAYISGNVLCRFTPTINNLDQITLDLNRALTVSSIGGPADSFTQNGDSLIIDLDNTYNPGDLIDITIYYEGEPVMAGGYKGLRYETHGNNEPIIATLSTPFLAHYWYPCKDGPNDKPDSVYVDITIENRIVNGIEMKALSNGVLDSVSYSGTKKTSYWRHRYPIVTYYVMVAISNYEAFGDEFINEAGDTLPLLYYAFNEYLQSQQEGVEDLPEVMGFFSGKYGDYPFFDEKYGMTQLGYYGAIENQTNTITNNMNKNWFMISAHELAHMWFGDMITCKSWNHAWLNEGFATYSEALWVEHQSGREAYQDYMSDLRYFGDGTIYLENPLDTFNVFTTIIYDKGAWTLHMLRNVVGDELFFQSINNYTMDTNFRYKNATTADFQQVVETTCNTDLDYFFEEWVYGEYFPYYYYNFKQTDDGKVFVSLYQAQQDQHEEAYAVFSMPVDITFVFSDRPDTTISVWNDEQLQEFEFDFPGQIVDFVYIDQNKKILSVQVYNPEVPVGVGENDARKQSGIYPNPFDNTLTVQVKRQEKSLYQIKIYSISGMLMMEQELGRATNHLNTSELASGVYFYSITNNQISISSGKIIKR